MPQRKSTAAQQLSDLEIKQDLSTFHLDDTWKKPNLRFLNAWNTRMLHLNLVLVQPTTESQKWIWFMRATIAPKLILSMSISQFEASEKLTSLAVGPTSPLFDHAKDGVIRLDQTKCLLQVTTHYPHETFPKPKVGKTMGSQYHSTGDATNSKIFISWDERQPFIPQCPRRLEKDESG